MVAIFFPRLVALFIAIFRLVPSQDWNALIVSETVSTSKDFDERAGVPLFRKLDTASDPSRLLASPCVA